MRLIVEEATTGNSGSPYIPGALAEKIRKCDIFVRDITTVARVAHPKDAERGGKSLPNPNVTFEPGLAAPMSVVRGTISAPVSKDSRAGLVPEDRTIAAAATGSIPRAQRAARVNCEPSSHFRLMTFQMLSFLEPPNVSAHLGPAVRRHRQEGTSPVLCVSAS